jgi:serine/threonine protein kinase
VGDGVTPAQIGPYPVERELGRGGMGIVYLAHDPRLGRPIAIKVLPESVAADAERLARFDREARLLAAVHHPNVASIFAIEEDAGRRYLVLEYVPGQSLADHLLDGPLSIAETLDVARQIAAVRSAGPADPTCKPDN